MNTTGQSVQNDDDSSLESDVEYADSASIERDQKKRLKLTLEIEVVNTFDLELALNEVLLLTSQGYLSGFDRNDTGRYRFTIETIN